MCNLGPRTGTHAAYNQGGHMALWKLIFNKKKNHHRVHFNDKWLIGL